MSPMTNLTADPSGGLPTYPWRAAPAGLATRRQLSDLGLRKAGQAPVAQILRPRRRRPDEPLVGFLYRIDLARPKRQLTDAMRAAAWTAARARQVCAGPCGRRDLGYIPRQAAPAWGCCWDCVDQAATDRAATDGAVTGRAAVDELSPGGIHG